MLLTDTERMRATKEPYLHSAIADAIFGATQQRVLGLLFGQPNRSFFATELMSLAESGRGAVQRELQRLERSRLVTVKKVGNQKHYQADPDSPIFNELCSIVRKTIGLREPLRAALAQIEDQLQVAVLYGSTAKGTDTAKSDIDILIVSEKLTLENAINAFTPVEKLLDRRINCTIYTPREFYERRRSKNPFISRMLEGPHDILAGNLLDDQ
jgi:predicted nucleotidyltransferase